MVAEHTALAHQNNVSLSRQLWYTNKAHILAKWHRASLLLCYPNVWNWLQYQAMKGIRLSKEPASIMEHSYIHMSTCFSGCLFHVPTEVPNLRRCEGEKQKIRSWIATCCIKCEAAPGENSLWNKHMPRNIETEIDTQSSPQMHPPTPGAHKQQGIESQKYSTSLYKTHFSAAPSQLM